MARIIEQCFGLSKARVLLICSSREGFRPLTARPLENENNNYSKREGGEMFRVLVFKAFCLMGLHATAEPRTCPVNFIKKNQIKTIVERRQTTFKHCLACEGDQCVFKEWPAEGQDFAAACKLMFCMTNMQVTVWLRRESSDDPATVFTIGNIFFNDAANKIRGILFCIFSI